MSSAGAIGAMISNPISYCVPEPSTIYRAGEVSTVTMTFSSSTPYTSARYVTSVLVRLPAEPLLANDMELITT